MIAGSFDLNIDEGADFAQSFTLSDPATGVPIPLTGFTSEAQIRTDYASTGAPLLDFTTQVDEPNGIITISLTATQLTGLSLVRPTGQEDIASICVWDLFITDVLGGNIKTRLLKGKANLYPQVTQ